MSNNSKQAICKNCDAAGVYHPIDWNEARRANLQTKKPLNMDGTIHNCPNYHPQGGQGQSFKGQPNPNNYNPQASRQPDTPYPQQGQVQPQQQQVVANPISSSHSINDLSEHIMNLIQQNMELREDILYMKQQMNEFMPLIREWMRYNPIQSSQSEFFAKILNERDELLRQFGPVTADKLKHESMGNEDIDPFEDDGSRDNEV